MYRKLLILIIAGLMLFPVPVYSTQFTPSDLGEEWLIGWSYRKMHNVTGQGDGESTNYQLYFNVEYGSGTDSGNTVYLAGLCQSDFDDIRFTDDDGETELDYWREEYTDSDDATFWVEVSDDLDSTTVSVYIYYGNEDVETTSNGENTFVIFSDFRRYFDSNSWTRISATNQYVYAEDVELVGTVDTVGKGEGMAFDGTYFYIGTFDSTISESWLYKIDAEDMTIEKSVEVTDGTLIHVGGICLYGDYLYISLAESTDSQVFPSKIKRYHADTLTYVNTIVTSEDYDNDHWGGVVIVPELDRLYVGNWGIDELYVFEIDGTYVTTIETPPDINIQDWVYVPEHGVMYGSKQYGDDNIISVWRPNGNGDTLTKVGEIMTEDDRTYNAFTWYNDYFYSGNPEPDLSGDIYFRKFGGNMNLTIAADYIYNGTAIGPNLQIEARINQGGNRKHNLGWAQTMPSTGTQILFHNYDGNCYIYEGNTDVDCDFDLDADTWTILSLAWVDDYAKAYKNRGSVKARYDTDISATALKPVLTRWGSTNADIFCEWLLIRNWVYDEPTRDSWGDEESQGWSSFNDWQLNIILAFVGLAAIPLSCIYLAKGGKKEANADKCAAFIIIIMLGWALFIGVIMS